MNTVHRQHTGFRPVTPDDLENIMRIERAAYKFPWTRQLMADCLSEQYFFSARIEQRQIIGYGIMSCVLQEAHILNLCIHPDRQRRGQGSHLLSHLLEAAGKHRCSTVYLEVRAGNHAARSLYQKSGFIRLGKCKDYYPAGKEREHALLYARRLKGTSKNHSQQHRGKAHFSTGIVQPGHGGAQ